MIPGLYSNATVPLASLAAEDVEATDEVYAGLWADPAQDLVFLVELEWRPPQGEG